jgi:O-antigen/teichoic acid export membrane protein
LGETDNLNVFARLRGAGSGVLGGAAIQLTGRALGLACTLCTIHVAAHYLGVSQFGDFALITDMAALLVIVAEIGVSAILAREISRE